MHTGALSAASALIVWSLFRVCGVVAVPAALSVPLVDRVRLASERHVATLMPMIDAYKAERQKPRAMGEAAPTLEDERVASRDRAGMRTLIVLVPPPARAVVAWLPGAAPEHTCAQAQSGVLG